MQFNVNDLFKDVKRSIKLSNFLLYLIIIVSGVVLFAPNSIIKLLYLDYINNNFKWIFGLLFLIAISTIILKILYGLYYQIINLFSKN